jgi:tRNA (cmo5U34)-methyltransferase
MLERSIPFYLEQQHMIEEIGKKFLVPGTSIYDLGCSTGTTLINLSAAVDTTESFVGYDNSIPMLDQARKKIREHNLENRIEVRYFDLNSDLTQLSLENAGMVTMCWTLQFLRPLRRDDLIKRIYQGLVENGILVVTEKVLTNSTHMNRFFIDFFYEFKKRNGYSNSEIQHKREALENVLIPYRIDENIEMFRRNGFEIADLFFLWYNFAGFLCIKKPV